MSFQQDFQSFFLSDICKKFELGTIMSKMDENIKI